MTRPTELSSYPGGSSRRRGQSGLPATTLGGVTALALALGLVALRLLAFGLLPLLLSLLGAFLAALVAASATALGLARPVVVQRVVAARAILTAGAHHSGGVLARNFSAALALGAIVRPSRPSPRAASRAGAPPWRPRFLRVACPSTAVVARPAGAPSRAGSCVAPAVVLTGSSRSVASHGAASSGSQTRRADWGRSRLGVHSPLELVGPPQPAGVQENAALAGLRAGAWRAVRPPDSLAAGRCLGMRGAPAQRLEGGCQSRCRHLSPRGDLHFLLRNDRL